VDVRVEQERSAGVARSIVDFAVTGGMDLIVMCTHGRSGLRHLLAGSNAQQIVASGRIPVLQVRPRVSANSGLECRRLLVPLDSNAEHEAALDMAGALASACGSDIHLLVVVPTLRTLRGERAAAARLAPAATAAILEMSRDGAEAYLNRLLARLQGEGVQVSGEIQRDDPARAIERTAKRIHADLIVLGTHRKTGADAFWAGSVASKVSNRSRLPVLLIPLESQPTGI